MFDANFDANVTNLAAARACKPSRLQIVTCFSMLPLCSIQMTCEYSIFATRDGFDDQFINTQIGIVQHTNQHWQINAANDTDMILLLE